jgi:hypothetical protein
MAEVISHHVAGLLTAVLDTVDGIIGGNRVADAVFYQSHHILHATHGGFGALPHIDDGGGNFLGGAGCAFCQLAHFICHHGKAPALFAGAGGFNGGVQGQQIGLVGHVLDHLDDAFDILVLVSRSWIRVSALWILAAILRMPLRHR